MQTEMYSWEMNLLALAHDALNAVSAPAVKVTADEAQLAAAYEWCRELTAEHSRSFYLSSSLLPPAKRQAARALYAFCRVSDDIVDESGSQAAPRLQSWRQRALRDVAPRDDLVALAWADARARYGLPRSYAEQLLDGVARDLEQTRYETFEELTSYCYGVASTVGLMSMHIIGYSGPEALPYAIKLGVALQMTNILRDIAEDWEAGRVYLPQEELADFSLDESDLAAGRVDERWRAFMKFQIERNRRLYQEAWPGIALLAKDGRLSIAASAAVYRAILDDIEAHDYDVFSRRAYVTTWGKLRLLPGLWWRNR